MTSPKMSGAIGLVAFLVSLLLYTLTLAPSLGIAHDTGELTTCCLIQGVPHSPGYPLFTALGWLASQLSWAKDPAWAINLLSALEASLAMGLLAAALSLVVRPWPALIGGLLTATSTAVWRQAVVAEVFALQLLFLCTLLGLALCWRQADDARRRQILLLTAAILGASLAHQHIMALAGLPFLLFGLQTKGKGRPWGFSPLALLLFLACWLLPYALQLYLAQQQPALNWENVSNLDRLWQHFLRRGYGTGLLNPSALETDVRAGEAQVTAFWIALVRSYFPLPTFLLGFLALDRLLQRRQQPEITLLLGLFLIYGPFFAWLGNQPSLEFYGDMMERFYSCAMVGAGGLIAVGLQWLADQRPSQARYWPALLLLVMYQGALNGPKSSQRQCYLAVDLARAQFAQLPPRAALILAGDLPAGAADFVRYGLGESRSRIVILSGLASTKWFRARLPAGLDLAAERGLAPGESLSNERALQQMVAYLQARGVEVYSNQILGGLGGTYTQVGLLYRFQGQAQAWELAREGQESARAFKILQAQPRRGPGQIDWRQPYWMRYCLLEWVSAYRAIARSLSQADPETALKAMDQVVALQPKPELESYLNRGGLYLRLKRYPEAVKDYEVALRLQPESRIGLQGIVEAHQGLGDQAAARLYSERLNRL